MATGTIRVELLAAAGEDVPDVLVVPVWVEAHDPADAQPSIAPPGPQKKDEGHGDASLLGLG